ncbi:SsgA family sporulation/cell division regulator [Streptomyces sp. NPDC050504]|uniref:SsgA family sporulation/cell division regulator n=1 Tax=Streptomyces sp. NPDC050504 TaxID=3365618 RepID=UPI0037AC0282
MQHTVTQIIDVRLVSSDMAVGEPVPLHCHLTYTAAHPLTVRTLFLSGSHEVADWNVGRQLLTCGMSAPTGSGDIRVFPGGRQEAAETMIRLNGVDLAEQRCSALVAVPTGMLRGFLSVAYQIVPAGCEQLDVAGFLDSVLAGE